MVGVMTMESTTYVRGLLMDLNSTNREDRERACTALVVLGDRRVVELLIRVLEEPDPWLLQLIRCFVRGVRERRDRVLQTACEVLGRLGDVQAVWPLIEQLNHADSGVRQAACEALGKLRDSRAVNELIKRLRDSTWGVRWAARAALVAIGSASVEPLIKRLNDERSDMRRAACEALGKLRDSRAVDGLIKRLEDTNSDVRQAACEALERLSNKQAVGPLIRRLGDSAPSVRQAACHALKELKEWELVWAMQEVLNWEPLALNQLAKEAWSVRKELKWWLLPVIVWRGLNWRKLAFDNVARLVAQGDVRIVEPLIELLDDPDAHVAEAAHRALEKALKPHANMLLCQSCLTQFEKKKTKLEDIGTLRLIVCRACEKASHATFNVREVVAVLDTQMAEGLVQMDDVVRVNALKRETLFDLDSVEIINASDDEIHGFCIDIGNDGDLYRRKRRKKWHCIVAGTCQPSLNTRHILEDTFRHVEFHP